MAPAGWLLAAEAVSLLASTLVMEGQAQAMQRREFANLPTLMQRAGVQLAEARQLLERARPWLPAQLRTDRTNALRLIEDGQRALASLVGERPGWQGAGGFGPWQRGLVAALCVLLCQRLAVYTGCGLWCRVFWLPCSVQDRGPSWRPKSAQDATRQRCTCENVLRCVRKNLVQGRL